jgi:hypothetical protein
VPALDILEVQHVMSLIEHARRHLAGMAGVHAVKVTPAASRAAAGGVRDAAEPAVAQPPRRSIRTTGEPAG